MLAGHQWWWSRFLVEAWRIWASNCGRVARAAVAAAVSSGKTSMSGLVVPVGWWETASAALCRTPGMCTMRKR